MSLTYVETLMLSIQDLNRLKQEFLEAYDKLFKDSFVRLKKVLKLKIEGLKICKEKEYRKEFDPKEMS